MPKTFAQIRAERKAALQEVRRKQRALDTYIERFERHIFRLLDRKTVLTGEDGLAIAKYIDSIYEPLNKMASAVADFYIVVSS